MEAQKDNPMSGSELVTSGPVTGMLPLLVSNTDNPGTVPNHTAVGGREYISFQGNRKMAAILDHEELDCWFSIGEISFYFILIVV